MKSIAGFCRKEGELLWITERPRRKFWTKSAAAKILRQPRICATRLRLVIADNSKADKTALENIEGVKGVFEASGQLQIILGTGTVNKVF